MYTLGIEKKVQVIASLVEGNSIRSTCRITGVAKGTITKLLVNLGSACNRYQKETFRNLPCKHIQCDEIWAFCYAKDKNVPIQYKGVFGYGDVWTWVAMDADTKLIPSWLVGQRSAEYAHRFLLDLKTRLANRVQITTDGHKSYLWAIEDVFGSQVDYGVLIKIYGQVSEGEKRYSPATCLGIQKNVFQGTPDMRHISTSFIERQNLTMRMNMRRFTRLTNAFSKKVENLQHAVGLHFMYYNFCRPHQTLNLNKGTKITPAMAGGLATKIWTLQDLLSISN